MTIDISAIAGIAQQQPLRSPGMTRITAETLGEEFGRMLFHTLLQSSATVGGGKHASKTGSAMPLQFFNEQLAQQLGAAHRQMFGQMLLSGSGEGGKQ